MSVTLLTDTEKAIQWFVDKIRRRLVDYSSVNTLTNAVEVKDEEIKNAIEDTIDRFNSMSPPIGNRTIDDFPSQDLLIIGSMSRILESSAILHARNRMPYSAGGMNVDTHSMTTFYAQKSQELWQKFEIQADEIKQRINLSGVSGSPMGLGSSYGVMSWYNKRIL